MIDKLENIDLPEVDRVVKDVDNIYVGSASGIKWIVAESNAKYENNEALPPDVPHQLAVLQYSEFCCFLITHK